MTNTIQLIREWGISKQITGIGGKATGHSQHTKTLEEVDELTEALKTNNRPEIADAIGDIVVTLILQADLQGMDFEECVEGAYQVISKRTGKMVDGVFVKDSPPIDEDLGELDATKACRIGDETCESCQ